MNSSYWAEGLKRSSRFIAAIDRMFVIPQDSYAETSSPKILTYLLWDRQICLSALGDSNRQSEFRRTRLSYEKL